MAQTRPANWAYLFGSAHKTEWRFDVNGVTYRGSDIVGTPVITKPLLDVPAIGRTCIGSLSLRVYPKGTIPKGAAVNAFCRLTSPDGQVLTSWVPQGQYFISSRSGKDPLSLVCSDKMMKAGQKYLEKTAFTEWPQPMSAVVPEIVSIMGVTLDQRTSIRVGSDYMVSYPNEDVLISEILGMIGVAHGGNWIMTESGSLRLIPLASPASTEVQDVGKAHSGFTLTGTNRSITRVTLIDDANNEFTYGAATDNGMELTARCDYATQSMAANVYSGLLGPTYAPFQYVPYQLDSAYLDLCVELGDTIRVTDRNGTQQRVVVLSLKIQCTVAGTANAAAGVQEETEDEYPYKSARDLMLERTVKTNQTYYGNRINRTDGFVSELLVNGEAKARMTANASVFTMQAYENGGWHDRIFFDPITGKYVIAGGVTFKALEEEQGETFIHGGNIMTGTVKAETIATGVLQSVDGRLKFDLTQGKFTVGSDDLETAISRIDNAVSLATTSQIFTKADGAESFTPATITLTATTSGSISTWKWYKDNTVISGATSATLIVRPTDITGNAATYKVVCTDAHGNSYTDYITIAKVSDGHQGRDGDPGPAGEGGLTILFDNEYIEVPVGINRKPTQASTYTCNVSVYKGASPLTYVHSNPSAGQYTIGTVTTPTGITVTKSTTLPQLSIKTSTASAINDVGKVTVPIITGDGLTISSYITVCANMNAVVTTHDSAITTLDTEISLRVTETTYHTDVPIYSSTDPSTSWTAAEKTSHTGCLWYNTSNATIKKWSGSQWVASSDSDGWAVHTESSLTLNANKISWMVASGTTASNFTLTDRAAELATKNLLIDIDEPNVSSAITGTASGASYGFSLTSDGYYTSTNGGVHNSYSMCLVTVTTDVDTSLYLDCINYGEVNYDYGVIGKLDVTLSNSIDDTASNILKKFTANSLDVVQVKIDVPAGTHTFNIKYRKDSSQHGTYDYFKFKVTQNQQRTRLHLKNGTTELSSATININGMVTFADLSNAGSTTVINGGLIKTGKIDAQYLQLTGAIAFGDLSDYSSVNTRINNASSTASSAYSYAEGAYDNVDALADGQYYGTFISGSSIYSPTIFADEFVVKPYNSAGSGRWTGGYSLYGYYGSSLYQMLKISYYQGDAPVVQFDSPARGYASWDFMVTYLQGGDYIFQSGAYIDFSRATCVGLSGATAVFG